MQRKGTSPTQSESHEFVQQKESAWQIAASHWPQPGSIFAPTAQTSWHSRLQNHEQPSPFEPLPSSQYSPGTRAPSPHVPQDRSWPNVASSATQMSSHTPDWPIAQQTGSDSQTPATAGLHAAGIDAPCSQGSWHSSSQYCVQWSPLTALPSSQGSPATCVPSPHSPQKVKCATGAVSAMQMASHAVVQQ